MTSNSEEVSSQSRPVSSKSAEISSKEEKPLMQETSNEIKTNENIPEEPKSEHNQLEKDPENISEQKELNQSETSSKDLREDQNQETIEPLQHEITTIVEESEHDINNAITLGRRDNNYYDSDIEGLEENKKNRCIGCLTDVFYCTIWFFRNIKSFILTCCRCGMKNRCRSNASVDSDDPDGNYVYSDLNETFNNEISSNETRENSFEVVDATAALAPNKYSYSGWERDGYYNSGADVGHKHSVSDGGRNHFTVDGGHNNSAIDTGHHHSAVHNHSAVDASQYHSAVDTGHHHSAVNDTHHYSAVNDSHHHSVIDAGHHHSAVNVSHHHCSADAGVSNSGGDGGTFSSGGDVSYDTCGGYSSCDFSGGDGGGDSGGGCD